jgi:uroporphyrin-III C-methyltransferase
MIPTISVVSKDPRVTLVGAGPGDPDLITVKGINAIRNADVVLFDALVSTDIIALIPEGIPALSVGKRAGEHSYSQDEINELIVELAYAYGHVVRLKGGDPFVFGRGSEEIHFARKHGVEVSIVPGISSAIAVPGSIGIPVTSRGIAESFWVVTGTTKSGDLSRDLQFAAQSSATVVILLGMKKVAEIMDIFKSFGKSETPVAVIQNGTLPSQKNAVGTVSTIVDLMTKEDLRSPGIIVVGEVVNHTKQVDDIIQSRILKNYE